jgi:hypothetical protein
MPRIAFFSRRIALYAFAAACLSVVLPPCHGQSSSASLSVSVNDTTGAALTDAEVILDNSETNQEQRSASGKTGNATFAFLKPGHYGLTVSKEQFATVSVKNIILNVGDDKRLQLMLKVGSATQSVTVDGSGLTINTTDGSVSTVIDRRFVENTPLDGRSFQSLILLTPGTVTNSPQQTSTLGFAGEFSVNGQRTESNSYSVDGVSANVGASGNSSGGSISGSLPSSTALGTTQALVSVDALQEFRVESSTYSAEYGRNPGGQFSMVTRSGTNDWHGVAFEYFRNDALDANSWFNDNTVPATAKTAERQNDFGGTFGGPIRVPHLYNGSDHTFFFASYEGLRLQQPIAATMNPVPTIATRQSATGSLQQVLNAFPLPTPGAPDLGSGLGEFIGGWSNPNSLDATSVRIDHTLGLRTHLFFRFSDAPSSGDTRGTYLQASIPSVNTSSTYRSHTYTFGATTDIARHIDNDFRLNFSNTSAESRATPDAFGGAVPVDLSQLQNAPEDATTFVLLRFGSYIPRLTQSFLGGTQQQWNVVDTTTQEHGKHTVKMGVDWRRLAPTITQSSPYIQYQFRTAAAVASNSIFAAYVQSDASNYPVYINFSAFAQDEWRLRPRLTLSMGLRWDVNPPPGVSRGITPYTVNGLDNLANLTLAPEGAALWKTSWYNFAPRLGIAYVVNSDAAHETVLRGGGGVFFDTGQQLAAYAFNGPGYSATNYFGSAYGTPASFPLLAPSSMPSVNESLVAPYGPVYTSPSHLQLPYTFQWNASLEQALGRSQSLTVSYVGANGRRLLEQKYYGDISAINPAFTSLYVITNGLTSSYNALQVKFQRQLSKGLQALGSYTWSHSLDYGSFNSSFPYKRGDADQDVRNNASAAISYDFPHSEASALGTALSSNWGIDGRFTARTGFPVSLNGNELTDPNTGQIYYSALNIVPNAPLFLYGSRSQYPGGRSINPAAFALPLGTDYGNAPRNFVYGFGAVQTDLSIRRSFPLYDKAHGEFRAESFNIFNHPNFGAIDGNYGDVQFGQATAILSQSLGTLSPLYQMGGPRSLQLSLRVTF